MTAEQIQTMLFVLGSLTAVCAGWIVVLLAIYALCKMSNMVTHVVLDSYGGWKTFLEYRRWYLSRRPAVAGMGNEMKLKMVCQHKRYSVDTREQTGTCYDCGAKGRMRFVVDTTPQPQRDDTALLRQALEALEASQSAAEWIVKADAAVAALKERLK